MTYPWLSESEMAATRAEHNVGDLLGDEDRAAQRELDAALEPRSGVRRMDGSAVPGAVGRSPAAPARP